MIFSASSRTSMSIYALSAMLVSLCGCAGQDHPTTAPVSGTVLYNGDPVAGATVSFWAEGAPRPATGVTNAQGEFQLSMFSANDGAIPGENKVVVSKVTAGADPPSKADTEAMLNDPTALTSMATGGGAGGEAPKSELPAKYGDQSRTPLKETVSQSGPNQFVIQLTD
jgi:hypothetical protein